MTIQDKQQQVVYEFSGCTTWEEQYSLLIQYSRAMNPYPPAARNIQYQVSGCTSLVWMYCQVNRVEGKLYFFMDADAILVKGLSAIMVFVFSGHHPSEITASNMDFIKDCGLSEHLSSDRNNGVRAMYKHIRQYAINNQ